MGRQKGVKMAKTKEKKSGKEAKVKVSANKPILATGKRKRAIAVAILRPGKGKITINGIPLELIQNEFVKLRIMEPVVLAGDVIKNYDIKVRVKGGGIFGQADAVRCAISRALVQVEPGLREKFLSFDRHLLVFDPRRTEPHKPSRSRRGPRAGKQQSYR